MAASSTGTAVSLISNDIEVMFPFPPYESQVYSFFIDIYLTLNQTLQITYQIAYINKVTRALIDGSNALLESPTGTGKTLSLLCASLAWQKHMRTKNPQAKKAVLQYSEGPSASNRIPSTSTQSQNPSVIVYASRTHAQLAQVVSELRNSGYGPRMTVLGSREQLCIHRKISTLKGSAINHACNALTAARGCLLKNNLESYQGNAEGVGSNPSPLLDIEELTDLGRRDNICPYFFSR